MPAIGAGGVRRWNMCNLIIAGSLPYMIFQIRKIFYTILRWRHKRIGTKKDPLELRLTWNRPRTPGTPYIPISGLMLRLRGNRGTLVGYQNRPGFPEIVRAKLNPWLPAALVIPQLLITSNISCYSRDPWEKIILLHNLHFILLKIYTELNCSRWHTLEIHYIYIRIMQNRTRTFWSDP